MRCEPPPSWAGDVFTDRTNSLNHRELPFRGRFKFWNDDDFSTDQCEVWKEAIRIHDLKPKKNYSARVLTAAPGRVNGHLVHLSGKPLGVWLVPSMGTPDNAIQKQTQRVYLADASRRADTCGMSRKMNVGTHAELTSYTSYLIQILRGVSQYLWGKRAEVWHNQPFEVIDASSRAQRGIKSPGSTHRHTSHP